MRIFRLIFIILLSVLPAISVADMISFKRVPNSGGGELDAVFVWNADSAEYVLSANGNLELLEKATKRAIQLPLRRPNMIDSLSIRTREEMLFMALAYSVGGDGGTMVCRMERRLAKLFWCRSIATINQFSADGGDSIWVGGYNYMAKISAASGKVVWANGNIQGTSKPPIDVSRVCPRAEKSGKIEFDSAYEGEPRKIRFSLDMRTGTIAEAFDMAGEEPCN